MRQRLVLILCLVVTLGIVAPTLVKASNYKDICSSARLKSADRKECSKRMKEAKSEAEQAQLWKEYDLKIAGFAPDGTRLKK